MPDSINITVIGEASINVEVVDASVVINLTEPLDAYQLAKLLDPNIGTLQEWIDSLQGIDGADVEFAIDAGWLSWRYVGEPSWIPLYDMATLQGPQGQSYEYFRLGAGESLRDPIETLGVEYDGVNYVLLRTVEDTNLLPHFSSNGTQFTSLDRPGVIVSYNGANWVMEVFGFNGDPVATHNASGTGQPTPDDMSMWSAHAIIGDVWLGPDPLFPPGTLFFINNDPVEILMWNGVLFTTGFSPIAQQSSMPPFSLDDLDSLTGDAPDPVVEEVVVKQDSVWKRWGFANLITYIKSLFLVTVVTPNTDYTLAPAGTPPNGTWLTYYITPDGVDINLLFGTVLLPTDSSLYGTPSLLLSANGLHIIRLMYGPKGWMLVTLLKTY